MKTTHTILIQFLLILLSILVSSNLVFGQDSEREVERQTYERNFLRQFQNTDFEDIPWMMIFSDGQLSYPVVKALFEQKVAGIDLVVEDRKLHKKWHIYQNMMEARQYADGKFHFQDDRLAAIKKYERVKVLEKSAAANFQFIGQDSSVLYTNNGRIERVNFHPSDPNIIWASAPEGGLWRSNDAGSTWNIIDENWEHLSVGDLVYNAHDNDTVYVATDDHDSWFNANRGVLRSDDGGVTWAVVGLPNSQAYNVFKLMMHPDGRTLYACTSQGLFISSDHGVTWIHNTALPINVNDLEFHPTNPMIIYATTRATFIPSTFDYFFVSTDGGATFTQMTAPIDAIAGTTQVTVSPNNPDIAYIAAYPGGQADPKQGGKVMKYTQSTNTITIVTPVTYSFPMPYWSLAGAWDFRIEVDPSDANHLIHGCVWTHESFDGGATWSLTSVPHADVHDIKWQTGTNRLWVAEDGGLSYTTDNGTTWNTIRKLPVMQWYSINSSKYGTVKLMGAQDAGVHVDYGGHWFRPGGGDGLEVKVDPVDSTLMYGTVQQGLDLYQIRYEPNTQTHAHVGLINQTSGGGQATWRQEVLIDAADRNILYTNYLDVFKSTDRGATWTNITNGTLGNSGAQIKYIYQPKSSPNILITGWDNQIKKSTDAGITWNSITHPGIYLSDQTQMVIHPSNPDLMWACGSGRVRKTTDGGTTWTEYTGTLSPALGIGTTIAYQDGTNDLLYVGGKYGNIYYRDNTMSDWTMHRTNMPNVWVQEIEVLPLIDKMRVATWGRGVWESPTAIPSMMPCNEPAPPSISVQQCGNTTDMTIAAAPSGYTIAWYKDEVAINGETATTLSVNTNGVYRARYLDNVGTCHSYLSESVNINFNAAVTLNTGKGINLDGTDDHISTANGAVDISGKSFSIEFWAKSAANGNTDYIIGQGGAATNSSLHIGFRSNGEFTFAFYNNDLNADSKYKDQKWHHWACVYDKSIADPAHNRFLYRDGVLVASDRSTSDFLGSGVLNIGTQLGDYFEGTLDDVKVWYKALSQTEVQTNAYCPLTCYDENLALYVPINEGTINADNTGLNLTDYSVNSHTLTLNNLSLNGTSSNIVTGLNILRYADADMDGYGDPNNSTNDLCVVGNYSFLAGDCDDTDDNINPLASEICGNSKDDNCDGYTDADDNTALNFDDATSNFLSIPVVDYTDDFAVEYWFKSETNSGGIKNIVRYEGATENWELGIWDNELGFLKDNFGWRFGGAVNDGQWHHLVMNYRTSDDNIKIYFDGQLKLNVSSNLDFEAIAMAIGSTTGGGRKWKGTLDEFRIWDCLLTDSEIADPELIRLEGNETGLLRYYPFDHGVPNMDNSLHTIAKDGTSNAADGTLSDFGLTGTTSNWVVGQNYTPLYFDEDQDGFGGTILWTCGSTANYTLDNLDTKDNDNMINPAALDICGTGMDENGNGVNDENTLSLKFDGSDDYVDLGNTLGNFGTSDFTIEARFKTTGTRDAIIAKRGVCSCDNFWNILVDTGGEMTFEIYNESGGGCVNGTTLISTTLVNDGNWHHVAVTRKNSVVRLFVDGVQEGMGTATADINTTYPLEIGKSVCNFDNFFLNGEIDEVRLWNYARGGSSVAAFKNAVVPASMTGLLAYYDFNNPSAASGQDNTGQTTLTDRTGNHNGTLKNFALNGTSSNWVGNPEVTKTWYVDTDMDGYGDVNVTKVACVQPAGYVDNSDDCNDNDGNISPGATEILGNNIDDDCDGATDEASSIKWVQLSGDKGTCTNNTDCCTQTFCYGLELTPASTGIITSYTTGFFVDCVGGNSPLLSNASCTMDDSSNAINGCATEGKILFNSSGNNGNLSVTAGTAVILHQVCFSIASGSSISITEDEITNITVSNQGTINFNNEFPAFATQSLLGNQDPVLTAGTIDACYMTVTAAEAAAIAATTATDDCPTAVVLTASTSGTCSAVITVTGTDECGLTSTVTYNTKIDGDGPAITGTASDSDIAGCDATAAPAELTSVTALEGLTGITDIMDNCTADANMTVDVSADTTGTCPIVITRTYTIQDECNNRTTLVHKVNINDTTNPTVTGTATDSDVAGCDATAAPVELTSITALEGLIGITDIVDNCTADANMTISVSADTTGTCPIVITRTYTIKDECNNMTTLVHKINIDDTTNPTVTMGSIATCYETVTAAEAAAIAATTASDNCTTIVGLTASTTGTCSAVITVTGTDDCGNTASVTYSTSITNSVAPMEQGGPVSNSSTIYNILDAVTPTTLPVFEDACGNTLTPTGSVQGGTHMTGDCDGTITYTYTYTDCAGGSTDWVYTYTLECSPLNLKIYLEGAYSITGDTLSTTLNNNHLLPGQDKNLSSSFSIRSFGQFTPFGQPYSAVPWSSTGNTGSTFGDASSPNAPANVTNYPDGVVDWILVTVRENGTSDSENIWTCAAWLYKDGSVGFPENCGTLTINNSSTYYIMVQHRNHLGIMGQAIIDDSGERLVMNFTTQNSIASVFRKGQKEVETGVWAMFSSNGEQEASRPSINSADRTTWGQLQNKIGYFLGDYDLNAVTNSLDETLWKNNQNTTTGVDLDND